MKQGPFLAAVRRGCLAVVTEHFSSQLCHLGLFRGEALPLSTRVKQHLQGNLFHMSTRLEGVVSPSDSSAASLGAACPLGGMMANLSRGAVCREGGGKPSYVSLTPDQSFTLASSQASATC